MTTKMMTKLCCLRFVVRELPSCINATIYKLCRNFFCTLIRIIIFPILAFKSQDLTFYAFEISQSPLSQR